MQNDARAGGADRVAEGDGAAVDIQLFFVQRAEGTVQAELFTAILLIFPRREAAEHLRREGLVDLPVIQIVEAEAVALEDRGGGVHRSEAHLRRIESRPFGVDDAS